MILYCPSCSSDKTDIVGLENTSVYNQKKHEVVKCKQAYVICKSCSKPLTNNDETHFTLRINVEKL